MNHLTLILALFIPAFLYSQGDLSEKLNNEIKTINLPRKSWSDTTLSWSSFYQYHQKKRISKFYQCSGANHLYEYVVKENKNGTLQMDRNIFLDSSGNCYNNMDSLRKIPQLTVQLSYSIIYNSSYHVLQIKYRPPIILESQQSLLEAHENYIWEDMHFGKWMIQVRDSMISNTAMPNHNSPLSPIAQAKNDSILFLMKQDELLSIKRKDSLEQLFVFNHQAEVDSCFKRYQENEISSSQECINCYKSLLTKFRFNESESLRLNELYKTLSDLTNEFNLMITKADQAFSMSKYDDALNYYQKALEINSKSQYALNQIQKLKQLRKSEKY